MKFTAALKKINIGCNYVNALVKETAQSRSDQYTKTDMVSIDELAKDL